MKNGDRLSGKVINLWGGLILFESPYAGEVSVELEQVAYLDTDAFYEVQVQGEKFNGRFFTDSESQFVMVENEPKPIFLPDIDQVRQRQESLAGLLSNWRSRADVSLIFAEGNSETENYNVLIESTLKRQKSEHAVALLINNEEAESVLTREQFDIDYGYKRFISEKWFASVTGEYFEDELKGVNRRITMSGGAGYQFWDNSLSELSIDLSMSAVREKIGSVDGLNPAIRLGLDYRRLFFSEKMELFHRQTILAIPDSERGRVLNASTGIRFELSTFVDTAVRIDTNHETRPAPGREKTDLTYTMGLGLKF